MPSHILSLDLNSYPYDLRALTRDLPASEDDSAGFAGSLSCHFGASIRVTVRPGVGQVVAQLLQPSKSSP